MRLIDADAAIDALKEMCEHYTPTKSITHPHIDFVIETLEELPTIEQLQWIPVSKEKPRDGQKVLITYEYQYGTNVAEAIFDEMRGKYYWVGYPIDKSSVVAWMPLPKAYEVKE